MRLSTISVVAGLSIAAACALSGQDRQQFAVTIGALSGNSPTATAGPLALGSGVAFQANYAQKIRDVKWGSVYWEINGLVSPLRHLSGFPVTATNEIRSVYATPGLKLQFTTQEKLTPWIAGGGGYAFYDAGGTDIAGGKTGGGLPFSGTANTYAVDFGAGVDYAAGKRLVLRGDVRGFYTGGPNFGASTTGGQFNFVIGGGVVWRFPK